MRHKNAFLKLYIYKPNLATHSINNSHQFSKIKNVKLTQSVARGSIINTWENLEIYKHFQNENLIKEQTQTKTKQNDFFNILKIIKSTNKPQM